MINDQNWAASHLPKGIKGDSEHYPSYLTDNGDIIDGWGKPLPSLSLLGQPPFRFPNMVMILHCGASGRETMIKHAHSTWLLNDLHVLASDHTNEGLGTVGFPDHPGELGVHFHGYSKYLGAHRPLAALLW